MVKVAPSVEFESEALSDGALNPQVQVEEPKRRQSVTWGVADDLNKISVPRKKLTDTTEFSILITILACFNVLFLGLEADYRCRSKCGKDDVMIWTAGDAVFTVLFVLDWLLACRMHGCKDFFFAAEEVRGRRRSLHWFRVLDTLWVFSRVLDQICSALGAPRTNIKCFSTFRIQHVVRLVKKLQVLKGFRELWLIMCGIMETMRSVLWVTVLLTFVMWVSATAFTLGTKNEDMNEDYDFSQSTWPGTEYYGSVPKTLLTLFQVLTRDRWAHGPVWPIVERNYGALIFFVAFLVVAWVALLNTVVGVIVESTLRSVRDTSKVFAEHQSKLETKIMARLERLVMVSAADAEGQLTHRELLKLLMTPDCKRALKMLTLGPKDMESLFEILDPWSEGHVEKDAFLLNTSRLKGPALTKDIYDVGIALGRQRCKVVHTQHNVKALQTQVTGLLEIITKMEMEVVRTPIDEKDPVLWGRLQRAENTKQSIQKACMAANLTKLVSKPMYSKLPVAYLAEDVERRRIEHQRAKRRGRGSILEEPRLSSLARGSDRPPLPPTDAPPPPPPIPGYLMRSILAAPPPHLPPRPRWAKPDAQEAKAHGKANKKGQKQSLKKWASEQNVGSAQGGQKDKRKATSVPPGGQARPASPTVGFAPSPPAEPDPAAGVPGGRRAGRRGGVTGLTVET